jgi:UDP-N-acetylmuramoyl-tripeptide--D-alanyl-D-alanine ligase
MTAADAITSMMTLRQVAAWLPGAAVVGNLDVAITRVHTDTRTLQAGDLFVALHGENFDANSMLVAAKSAGAVAALCHPGASGGFATTGLPCVEVDDTLVALCTLARCWRAQFSLPHRSCAPPSPMPRWPPRAI